MTGPLLLAVALGLVAPVPENAEKPKPRARLVGTLTVPAHVEQVVGLPVGKHLALRSRDALLVVPRDQFAAGDPAAKPVSEIPLPARTSRIALTPDGTHLYAEVPTQGRVSAEPRVQFWAVKRLLEGKEVTAPDREVPLDTHHATAATLAADGRHLLAVASEPQAIGQPVSVLNRYSATTGDLVREFVRFDDPALLFGGHVFDPKANRVYAQFQSADQTVLRSLDYATGKAVWERGFGEKPYRGQFVPPVMSSDGRLVAAAAWQLVMRPNGQPQPGQPVPMQQTQRLLVVVLDAKTGEPIEFEADEYRYGQLVGFSADGRLLAARVWEKNSGGIMLVVWDTKTGKPLKTWTADGDLIASFAATGHELITVDRETTSQVVDATSSSSRGWNSNSGGRVTRTISKSTLGVWDLSPLTR
jgi:hypothetical protein